MSVAIKVENLSKTYRLGQIGKASLQEEIASTWAKIRGKPDPTLPVNQEKSWREGNLIHALQDINFEVQQGEVLGIIGKNGAGKSTLLKILSKVTSPSSGQIKIRGRIASLLEVGTGMHPELTGRENIFLNGAILGMHKAEIKRQLDAIIDFAGVSDYIDTPIKRYSSGMRVRLGFAVAAFLEPEILIVDEVLAVGDAEFQKKAIGKIQDVSKGQGRTVLFVSHNTTLIKAICNRVILILKGKIQLNDLPDYVISQYLGGELLSSNFIQMDNEWDLDYFKLISIGVKNIRKSLHEPITRDNDIELIIQYNYPYCSTTDTLDLTLHFKTESGMVIFVTSTIFSKTFLKALPQGGNLLKMYIPSRYLNEGTFSIDLYLVLNRRKSIKSEKDILSFIVITEKKKLGSYLSKEFGFIQPTFDWHIEKIND